MMSLILHMSELVLFLASSKFMNSLKLNMIYFAVSLFSYNQIFRISNRTREDAIFALELAESFQKLQDADSAGATLELYHHMSISPFLTAKLELHRNVRVVHLKNSSVDLKSCIRNSLSMTHLDDVMLVEPSILVLSQPFQMFNDKKRMAPRPEAICQRNILKGGSITSTSEELDGALKFFVESQKDCKFNQVSSYESSIRWKSLEKQEILLSDRFTYVGTVFSSEHLSFINPTKDIIMWSPYYLDSASFHCGDEGSAPRECGSKISLQFRTAIQRYRHWMSILLLDRQVGWIAHDGGLVPQEPSTSTTDGCHSFNSLEGAKKSMRAARSDRHKTIMNIDLIMTHDKQNVAMHSESSFGPLNIEPHILKSPSIMTMVEAQHELHNPCLSSETILQWLDGNPYRSYAICDGCLQGISSAKSFLDEVVLEGDTSIIFDLKVPGSDKQSTQVQGIISMIRNGSRSESDIQQLLERVSVRYFAESGNGNIILEALPIQLYNEITSEATSELNVYVNAPSKEACIRMVHWSAEQGTNLAGCFVIQGHVGVTESWQTISRKLNITKSLRSTKHTKLICDVPREQTHPDSSLWKDGLIRCMENGYEWIHYPFPVASTADYSLISKSMIAAIVPDGRLIEAALSSFYEKSQKSESLQYISHWGVTSPYNWRPHQQQWSFVGDGQFQLASENDNTFRCVTKILTVMLFLRLEEIGLISIDDAIVGPIHKVTWKQVFSNTAGINGNRAGRKFEYSNSLWSYVSNFIQNVTGVPFVEAITFYILNPMGLSGSFNEKSIYPPFVARGFIGSNRDLLLIGSTLASGGVSLETRLRVISSSSVDKMLYDWTSAQNVTKSFMDDKTVHSMKRFYENDKDDRLSAFGVVDGYGMGLWRVKGWRTRGERSRTPVRGWLAMGSSEALMYFDEDGIVVGMCAPNRTLGLELTAPFASIVREMGSCIDKAFDASNGVREKKQVLLQPRINKHVSAIRDIYDKKQLRGISKTAVLTE